MYKISAEKLKTVRKRAKKTQSEMGYLIGKNKADVSHYENNRATPPANALVTMMIELDLRPSDIAEKII